MRQLLFLELPGTSKSFLLHHIRSDLLSFSGVILAYMCVKLQMRLYVCHRVGPFWVHFGSILGPFWVHFGSILGPYWVQFVFRQESMFRQESTTRQESATKQEYSLDKNSNLDC